MEKGLKSKDLVGKIGTKGHVSAILQGKKPLTLHTARVLHAELGIPAEVFFN
jgi:HTH-type transcriptional regulator / antitoxin HigA